MEITSTETVHADRAVSGKRTYKPAILILAFALLVSLSINGVLGWRMLRLQDSVARLELGNRLNVGEFVPPIKARGIDGQSSVISFQGSDRPTLLYFFSPGCDTCEHNVKHIVSLAERKGSEYKIIGLSLSEDGLQEYVKEKGLNFPVYSGLGVEPTLAYKLGRVPQTTVVSPVGRVLANWHGPFDGRQKSAIESYFGIAFSE